MTCRQPSVATTVEHIREHYDGLSGLYAALWGDHIHHGYWTEPQESPRVAQEHMVRQLALIYRKDKALSKAALGFIEVTLKNAAIDGYGPGAVSGRARAR